MQTEKQSEGTSSPPIVHGVGATQQGAMASKEVTPAKIPAHSRAAAAQRLNDVPQRSHSGVSYEGGSYQPHPAGWRIRRYLKRKNLRQSNLRYAAVDRIGTRTMLPMAFVAFMVFLTAVIIWSPSPVSWMRLSSAMVRI